MPMNRDGVNTLKGTTEGRGTVCTPTEKRKKHKNEKSTYWRKLGNFVLFSK